MNLTILKFFVSFAIRLLEGAAKAQQKQAEVLNKLAEEKYEAAARLITSANADRDARAEAEQKATRLTTQAGVVRDNLGDLL